MYFIITLYYKVDPERIVYYSGSTSNDGSCLVEEKDLAYKFLSRKAANKKVEALKKKCITHTSKKKLYEYYNALTPVFKIEEVITKYRIKRVFPGKLPSCYLSGTFQFTLEKENALLFLNPEEAQKAKEKLIIPPSGIFCTDLEIEEVRS